MRQVLEYVESSELQDVLNFVQTATPKSLSPGSVPSFQVAQILTGDCLYLPFGFVFLERALNGDSITLKVTWSGSMVPWDDLIVMSKQIQHNRPVSPKRFSK